MSNAIIRAPQSRAEQHEALRWLSIGEPNPEEHAENLLKLSEHGCFPIDGLILMMDHEKCLGGGLTSLQNDGTAMVWLPQGETAAIRRLLMEQIRIDLIKNHVLHGQCLIDGSSKDGAQLLLEFDFERISTLKFLRHQLKRLPGVRKVTGLSNDIFAPAKDGLRLANLISQTYEGSLDCTALSGRRSGEQAIKSHQQVGNFDPSLWRIYRHADQDVGVALLNDHTEQNSRELVYVGLVPAARNRGFGSTIVQEVLSQAQIDGCKEVLLAVDASNTWACALYNKLGFQEFARHTAYLWFPNAQRQVA